MKSSIIVAEPDLNNQNKFIEFTSVSDKNIEIIFVDSFTKLIEEVENNFCSLIITNVVLHDADGRNILEYLNKKKFDIPVVLISDKYINDDYHLTDFTCLINPFSVQQIENVINDILFGNDSVKSNSINLIEGFKAEYKIVGENKEIKSIFNTIDRLKSYSAPILITGETGVGKELVARKIYSKSEVNKSSFLKVSLSNIPKDLIEIELFGYEKGAFTGANNVKIGYFEKAVGGTIFLDDINNVSFGLQQKLLRVLQDGEITRIGSQKPIKIDVRIICSSNEDLIELIEKEKFRKDLYYNISTFVIDIPPLRKRIDDLELLVDAIVSKFVKLGVSKKEFNKETIDLMKNYYWPGNIKELENLIQRSMVLSVGKFIENLIVENFIKNSEFKKNVDLSLNSDVLFQILEQDLMIISNGDIYEKLLLKFDEAIIDYFMIKYKNNKSKVASVLGINRNTLSSKIKLNDK